MFFKLPNIAFDGINLSVWNVKIRVRRVPTKSQDTRSAFKGIKSNWHFLMHLPGFILHDILVHVISSLHIH